MAKLRDRVLPLYATWLFLAVACGTGITGEDDAGSPGSVVLDTSHPYTIASASTGLCLQLGDQGSAVEAKALLVECKESAVQQFEFELTASGTYAIMNVASGYCLAASSQADLVQSTCSGMATQRFSIRDAGERRVKIICISNGKILEAMEPGIPGEAQVILAADSSRASQLFTLTRGEARDAGRTDAGSRDAGVGDAGGSDRPDAGRSDAEGFDAGRRDAGELADGGSKPDAGQPDAGRTDGGRDAGIVDAGARDAGAGGSCDLSDPPANVSAWINESWNAQLKPNITNRKAWLLDSVVKGKGVINLCIRWSGTAKFTTAWRDQIVPSMTSWFNAWFKALGSYGCFPYPDGIEVRITGVAVKQKSILEWTDDSIPIYTETDPRTDPPGEPKCPDNCSFFVNWNHSFPKCSAGEEMHFDYDVWLGDTLPGGAGAVGGDWGVRMPRASFTGALGRGNFNMIEHEMGHSFGMQDYYDWTGSRPNGGSVMIVGTTSGGPTIGDTWLLRRVWKEQKSMRGW